jgi:hypothetical protein
MNGKGLRGVGRSDLTGEVAEVSGAVSAWVEQVGRFLGVVQAALEQSRPREDATAEVRAVAGQLPALIRQCRAQVPSPEMIRTWVQTLTENREAPGGRDGHNDGAHPPKHEAPTARVLDESLLKAHCPV